MRSSLKKRIINALVIGVLVFITCCVLYNFFIVKEKWLYYSLIAGIFWAVGYFNSKTITNIFIHKSIWKIIGIECLIICLLIIILIFVLGFVCDISNWKETVWYISSLFGISTFINN